MSQEYDDYSEYDECQRCNGDGFIFDCFDGFCADADEGCDDCTRPCPECTKRPASPELRQILADALADSSATPTQAAANLPTEPRESGGDGRDRESGPAWASSHGEAER